MALIVEKENPPAGTNYKVGDNAELDAAIQAGKAGGITVGADGYYIKEDGGRIESAGGTTKLVDLSGATAEDMANIAKLAEAHFLAQTTGVSVAVLDAAKKAVGLDPSDLTQNSLYYKILDEAGYNSGDPSKSFDKNGYSGADPAVNILRDRLSQKPTDDELEAAGLDPSEYTVVNNNAANAFYVEQELAKQGLSYSSTNAVRASTRGYLGRDNDTMQQVRDSQDALMLKTKGEGNFRTSDKELDMLEWDLVKNKQEGTGVDTDGYTVGQGGNTVGSDASGTPIGGQITGGFTADPNTLNIPSSAVTPTLRPSALTGGGNYTVPAQTFDSNLKAQETAFKARESEQAKMYQPQTMQEKQDVGESVSSYAISQKLYRNPNTGQQIFVAFQGDKPLQPIPAGFYELNQSSSTFQSPSDVFNPITAGGNTFTGANTGGVIQGYSGEEGSVVTPNPSPIDVNQIYGDVSFTDPVTGQVITQTPGEYFQSLANKQAQATFNPATSVAMPGVSTMTELGYEYDTDGTIKTDPTTGAPVTKELMPGTVLESTAGQAQATAPIVTGDQIAQVGDITQARGPGSFDPQAMLKASGNLESGSPFRWEPSKNKYVLYSPDDQTKIFSELTPDEFARAFNLNMADYGSAIPGAAQAGLTTAAPGVAQQLQGDTSTDYQGMADAVAGANWDVTTGTFNMNGQTFTPDQFIAANNLSVGDYLTTTGGLEAVTSTGPTKTIDAAQQTTTSLAGLTSQTSDSIDVSNAPIRGTTTMDGVSELITGTGVDQAKVLTAFGEGELKAASVQDELSGLMAQFDDGNTPAWAAGSMRAAMATLAQRGLGASSMAGQAIIQAAMEAALPIAQIDAGNKQQMALFKGEQRAKFLQIEFDQAFQVKVMNAAKVSEIANMNFTADQQIALENSKAANTMQLQNLSNKQALVMAEAAALSQLDLANLSNLQQAQVQNAQNFLQIDMANLSNKQSTALFKSQQVTNAMLSDAAQANATAQFNATSENQTNQFFSNLSAQVSQFNAAQQNAINQFNAEEANALLEFNSALQNQREMFNAQNYLAVAQANAQWRQNINTSNTEAQNIANLTYAKEVNGLTQKSLDDYWQKERDIMSYAFAQSEGAADRALKILLGEQSLTSIRDQLEFKEEESKAKFWSDLLFGDQGFSDVFKMASSTTTTGGA